MGGLLKKIQNIGVSDKWSIEKQSAFHLINIFFAVLAFTSLSAIPVTLFFNTSQGLFIQLIFAVVYCSVFFLTKTKQLKTARKVAVYSFETHILLISFFTISPTSHSILPIYSPIFVIYAVYPLLSALFNLNLIRHFIIAISHIIIIQFADFLMQIIPIKEINTADLSLVNIVVVFYALLLVTVFIYLIIQQNKKIKAFEAEKKKKLVELNAANKKMFSIISHDLKSPISTIIGFSELLIMRDKEDDETLQFSKAIYETANKQHELLSNLLNWSRSQLNQVSHSPRNLDLGFIVEDILEDNEAWGKLKKIDIQFTNTVSKKAFADEDQVRTVIRNLLSNAMKFTPSAGKIIFKTQEEEHYIVCSVQDTGIGMEDHRLIELFKPNNFSTTKGTNEEHGSGLGLKLCQDFVVKNGGKIWAESQLGKGTTFYFTLPVSNTQQ
jgi:signal transduction histidine kinase